MSTTTELPAPLVPAEVDLRDFQFMPVDVSRVLKSETWGLGTGDEKAAAMTLWLESWQQVPAGSLPENDRMLAKLSQCDRWAKSRDHVLRGWVLCSDRRLYHPVVCEKALEAWIEKLSNSLSGAAGNAKRWGVAIDLTSVRAQFMTAVEMLKAIAPQSKTLKKKVVAVIMSGSPPDNPPESPPDSGPDRKGQRRDREGIEEEKTSSSSSAEPTSGSDGEGSEKTRPTVPCPYGAIVDAYHAALPTLPKVKLRDGPTWADRQKAMRGLWGWVLSSRKSDGMPRAETAEQALAWVRSYFARAAQNDFVMGRTPRAEAHRNWRADFDFLLSKNGLKQVIEKTLEAAA